MKVEAFKLNSFTKSINGGNPAGVVIDAEVLDEVQMQSLAAMIGFSETAFISQSDKADFKVRFFTPCSEVDLCGHATIAAFSLLEHKGLIKDGEYTQETKAGILKIRVKNGIIFMQQSMPRFFESVEKTDLLECTGINSGDFADNMPVQIVSTGIRDILIPLKTEQALIDMKPNMGKIEEISKKYNVVGLHVFTLDVKNDATAICRNFAPLYGIPEESATGTSNGALACYLQKYGFISDFDKELKFEQGIYMNKPSVINAKLLGDGNILEEIWIGGEALFVGGNTYQI